MPRVSATQVAQAVDYVLTQIGPVCGDVMAILARALDVVLPSVNEWVLDASGALLAALDRVAVLPGLAGGWAAAQVDPVLAFLDLPARWRALEGLVLPSVEALTDAATEVVGTLAEYLTTAASTMAPVVAALTAVSADQLQPAVQLAVALQIDDAARAVQVADQVRTGLVTTWAVLVTTVATKLQQVLLRGPQGE